MEIKARTGILKFSKEIFAWALSLLVIVPFLIILLNALKTTDEAFNMSLSLPSSINWGNFIKVWKVGNIARSYANSSILSGASVILSVFSSSLCGFVLSRNRTKIKRAIYIFFALGFMFPVNMVTVVKVMRLFNLYNSHAGVIMLFTALILPMSIFLYHGFISSIPKEMDEAGIIDGAKAYKLFFQIIFPMLKPVTVTVVILNFLNTWNDFTIPLYLLPDPSKAVIVQQVYNFFGRFTASWNLVSVTILFAVIPIVVVYILGQRYIISGMVSGALKG